MKALGREGTIGWCIGVPCKVGVEKRVAIDVAEVVLPHLCCRRMFRDLYRWLRWSDWLYRSSGLGLRRRV